MKFEKGADLVAYIKKQLDIDIKIDTTFKGDIYAKGVCYIEIPAHKDIQVKALLAKNNIRLEHHLEDRYFVIQRRV